MHTFRVGLLAASAAFLVSATATAEPLKPMRFFEGRTESFSTIKLLFKKPYRNHTVGRGLIEPDGSLLLVQRVEDDGKPPRERRWRIREIGPGRFAGAMSEANGPVAIDEQLRSAQASVTATSDTLRLVTARYRGGIDPYLTTLDAQRSLYAAQRAQVAVALTKANNAVALYRALGADTLIAQSPAG